MIDADSDALRAGVHVTGPIGGGDRGHPFAPGCAGPPGYVVEEFFVEGDARSYRLPHGAAYDPDGRWDACPDRVAAFRTRMIVVRPRGPERFGGSVVVNWQNVTRGFEMGAPPSHLAELGLAWVGVSAQVVGHRGFPETREIALRGWDPRRYGDLLHPGDDFSFDIFSQAAAALGTGRSTSRTGPDPLGGLRLTHLVATGASQSALRLRAYINAVHPLARLFDAYLLALDVGRAAVLDTTAVDSTAAPLGIASVATRLRCDTASPVMVVNSESEVLRFLSVRQPDTARFRLWEVAGSAHIGHPPEEADETAGWLAEMGVEPGLALGRLPPDANTLSHTPVQRAALVRLLRWVRQGIAPPVQPRVEIARGARPEIRRDRFGNAVGGLRLPEMEVPLATNRGLRDDDEDLLGRISGSSVPLSAEQIGGLYSGPPDYLERYSRALAAAVSRGVLLEREGPALLAAAEARAARIWPA